MQASNPRTAIVCDRVTTPYSQPLRRPILQQVSLTIGQGEFVALLGLNGAGKSSLLRAIVGLLPIQSGGVEVAGIPVTPRHLPRVRQQVGMLFQGGGLVRQLTVLENVLCGCLGQKSSWQTLWGFSQADRRRALDLLTSLGLRDQAEQRTGQLSGGQQQRVAIARALIQSPQILLVDEPTTGLDICATQTVMDRLAGLNRDQGLTIVTVLHDLTLASRYAQRMIVLDQGQIVHDGSSEHLAERFAQMAEPA